MIRKALLLALVFTACSCPVLAQTLKSHNIQFINEWGQPVNLSTSVSMYIYQAGTSTQLSCWKDARAANAVTQPVTDNSTNTPLIYDRGLLTFFSKKNTCKLVVTDGTYNRTIDNIKSTDTRILWPTYQADFLNTYQRVEVFDANDTLTAAESGKVCVSEGHGTAANVIFTLPTAAAGLTFTIVDANATAADDVWITAAAGDTINGGTAAKSYKCVTDAVKQAVTLIAIDDTQWIVKSEVGTWANDNN